MRMTLSLVLLPVLLLWLHAAAFGVASVGVPAPDVTPTPASIAAVALLESTAVVLAAWTSRGRGAPLAFALFLAYFGAKGFMSQIESAFFLDHMPTGSVLRTVGACLLIAAAFAPAVVGAVGRWHGDGAAPRPLTGGGWRWAALPVIYIGLYLGFGYHVAWVQPELRAFYGGDDPAGFFPHVAGLFRDDPWLIPFQVLRTALWTAFSLPLLRLLGGAPWQAGLALGGVLGVGLTAQLLLANPFMPEAVRLTHFAETLPSTALFGVALGWLVLAPTSNAGR